MAAAMRQMAANFSKLEKFEGVDFRRWQKNGLLVVKYECGICSDN